MPESQPSERDSARLSRAWYATHIRDFLEARDTDVIGHLTNNSDFAVETSQRNAWLGEIAVLKSQLAGLEGHVFFEFNIPRMGRRIDVVLIVSSVLFVLEFKVGEEKLLNADLNQVWDYALDLKNFHEGSHPLSIVPVLIATESPQTDLPQPTFDDDRVARPVAVHADCLRNFIDALVSVASGSLIDGESWTRSSYRPTPTIIEAARFLYANHSVDAISRSDADAKNLRDTSARIEEIVRSSRERGQKAICFVTGVPGAGKTLVGLNLATMHGKKEDSHHSVFLSGNGPLVAVLREALTRDEFARQKAKGAKVRKGKVAEGVKAFIQNVHHFRDDALRDDKPPSEHVVIFDEAQRAWNLKQTANFMKRKKGMDGFNSSEPEFLVSCMERHHDWAVVVCLVGGGQEINTGEAGISAWLQAMLDHYPDWELYISSNLSNSEYAATEALAKLSDRRRTYFEDDLHLAVSMRSFRAEHVSEFIRAVLDCEMDAAKDALHRIRNRYPLVVTRDLDVAKRWILNRARGNERYGLVASSKAMRLKPHAIDVRVDIDPVHWFLNDRVDTRSSYYLEDAATEFQVQGLELDWVCVNWDGDLRFRQDDWTYHDFRGSGWQNVNSVANRNYLKNAYRVLLTRARQGMVIFIPPGDASDPTRLPTFYDETFGYLQRIGVTVLS